MKSIPRAILCTTLLLFACFLFLIMMPIDREGEIHMDHKLVDVVGWEYNTTRNTSQYIARNNLTPTIMPDKVCDQRALVVIVVCTAPGNFEERNAIRETWGSQRFVKGNNVSLYFLVGETMNSSIQNDVLLESDVYSDIIQERFVDSYNNLTLKSIAMLKVVTSYCTNTVRYLLKIDDDMFVNVPLLVEMLLKRNNSENVLAGKLICWARPIKDSSSKWYSPRYMFQGRVYPNYVSGTGYLMSMDVARKLFNTALTTPIFHLEDVYLTGICAKKAHIKPQNHPMFSYRKLRYEPCEFRNLVTMHHFPPQVMRDTYSDLRDPLLWEHCKDYRRSMFDSHTWLFGNFLKPNKTHRKNRCE